MTTVLVVSRNTRMFRVAISHVECFNLPLSAQDSDVWFEFDFDNFRSFVSPVASGGLSTEPKWPEFEMLFTYETTQDRLLLAKIMRLTVYCVHDGDEHDDKYFVGEGSCDLMSIALGPPSIVLNLRNGNCEAGQLCLEVQMEEISETKVVMDEIEFNLLRNFEGTDESTSLSIRPDQVRLELETKSGDDEAFTISVDRVPDRVSLDPKPTTRVATMWKDCGVHYYGTTVSNLYEENGLRVHVTTTGLVSNTLVGTGLIMFGSHIDRSQTATNSQGAVTRDVAVAFEDVNVIDPDGRVCGKLNGKLRIFRVPGYVQMRAGTNLDGEIFDGVRFDEFAPVPPRVVNMIVSAAAA